MTRTLPTADIRGYYTALGITLPGWARTEASVRCFVNPDQHERADRDPSMSINLQHGAFHCHACGAKGGAYDAALSRGHEPRSAIELMIAHHLTDPRPSPRPRPRPVTPAHRSPVDVPIRRPAHRRPRLVARDRDIAIYRHHLRQRLDVLKRLAETRGWTPQAIDELELGLDHDRITIPVRGFNRELVALLRYQPGATEKLRAAPGSRRALYPHPAHISAPHVLLVEGEPDRIAAHSHGLPAIAVPGVDSWRPEWAHLLSGRQVTIVMDCDHQGRAAARRIAAELRAQNLAAEILDLDPDRSDGYDLTDFLRAGKRLELSWR